MDPEIVPGRTRNPVTWGSLRENITFEVLLNNIEGTFIRKI